MALSQINFFVELFAIQIFFQTHVHLGTLTFQKNLNHKNFLEKLDLRDGAIVNSATRWKFRASLFSLRSKTMHCLGLRRFAP